MNREYIERLRDSVSCQTVLETLGFALDTKESTRRAVKYRRAGEIVIVIHSGRGWFDPLGDAKGDVFGLITHLQGCDFLEGCMRVAALADFQPSQPALHDRDRTSLTKVSIPGEWGRRRSPWPGSATWQYLRWERSLPASVIRAAVYQGVLREGPCGSAWAAHTDGENIVCGWEARGPAWRGFATDGSKVLFRLGAENATRLCVTEAAIDAMSLAALEGMRDGTLYLSTGGGWAPATVAALRQLAAGPDIQLVAATDRNSQGDVYAERLRALAEEAGCAWLRLRPAADDWNELLKKKERERREMRQMKLEESRSPHSRQPYQGGFAQAYRPSAPAGLPAAGKVG